MLYVILLCVAVMILASASPKPTGWVALVFSVLALLVHLLKWP